MTMTDIGLPDQATVTRCLEEARRAMPQAHAPYSGWKVGAALLAEDGTIYHGSNVETSTFESGLCAERAALANAIAQGAANAGPRFVRLVAISMNKLASANPQDIADTSPCGTCRQVIHDFADPQRCCMVQDDGKGGMGFSLGYLLPQGFRLSVTPRPPCPVDCAALEAEAAQPSSDLAALARRMSGNAAAHVNGYAEGAMIVSADGTAFGGASVENSNTQLFIRALTAAATRGVIGGQSGNFIRRIGLSLPERISAAHDFRTALNPSLLMEFTTPATEITILRGESERQTLSVAQVMSGFA